MMWHNPATSVLSTKAATGLSGPDPRKHTYPDSQAPALKGAAMVAPQQVYTISSGSSLGHTQLFLSLRGCFRKPLPSQRDYRWRQLCLMQVHLIQLKISG